MWKKPSSIINKKKVKDSNNTQTNASKIPNSICTSKRLLNEIDKIIYSLNRENEITKKVCNNIMNSIQFQYQMDTITVNSENIKTSDSHRSTFNLTDEINLKRND